MKDEEEKMHEFMKDFTNAHDNLPKVKGIDGTFRAIKISMKTALIIGAIVAIVVSIPVVAMIYDKTMSVMFTMDKDAYIHTIENTYGQRLSIISDESTKKGNGVILFRTERKPIVEFKAVKTISGGVESYDLEYEGNALNYYIEKGEETFQGIEIEKTVRNKPLNMFESVEIGEFKAILSKEDYSQIEEGVRQLLAIKKFMQEKIKKFEIPMYLKIGDYTNGYDYKDMKEEEEIVYQTKQSYYWHLKENEKDISAIPEEDLLKIDRPKVLDVYVNGEKLVDKKQTEANKYYAEKEEKEYKIAYIVANYNSEEKYYEVQLNRLIPNCEQFEILSDNINMEYDFKYQGKKYGIRYFDNKVHEKKLPASGNIEFLEELLKIKLEYDYLNKKVNLIIP